MINVGVIPYYYEVNTNPYQKLFAESLESAGLNVTRITDRRWLPISRIRRKRLQVLHMDWASSFYLGRNAVVSWVKGRVLSRRLGRLGQTRMVWTMHNLTAHDARQDRHELGMRQIIIDHCSALMLHSDTAVSLVRDMYHLPDGFLVRRIPHGHYIDAYPNTVSRDEARSKLGIEPGQRVVLFFGRLRPYKGLDSLVEAFSRIGRDGDVLMIAGLPFANFPVGRLRTMAKELCPKGCDIRIDARHVLDDELQIYFGACDVVALPFRSILQSGSLLLAMSFGRCVVAPSMGSIPEVACQEAYFGYDPQDGDGLAAALRLALDQPDLLERGAASMQFARERYDWPDIGRKARAMYEEILGRS